MHTLEHNLKTKTNKKLRRVKDVNSDILANQTTAHSKYERMLI